MGAWGPGLYSSDVALDLRGALRLLLRTPLSVDAIILQLQTVLETGTNPDQEDYTTFWLVLADQLARAGVAHAETFRRARDIVASGADSAMMTELGLSPGDVRKRAAALAKLAASLEAPLLEKPRKGMKRQPLLFAPGDIIACPSWAGHVQNPYMPDVPPQGARIGVPQGWSCAVILHAVRVFDTVAVYAAAGFLGSFETRPLVPDLLDRDVSEQAGLGTLPPRHAKIMGIEVVGRVTLDRSELDPPEKVSREALVYAASDISLANHFSRFAASKSACKLRSFAAL